jgi:hypothetical protein
MGGKVHRRRCHRALRIGFYRCRLQGLNLVFGSWRDCLGCRSIVRRHTGQSDRRHPQRERTAVLAGMPGTIRTVSRPRHLFREAPMQQ